MRLTPGGPCVGFVTPLGGPASGISPLGGDVGVPTPSCRQALNFSDCFAQCEGVINKVSPGPVCGWTFAQAFGDLAGQISFSPGVMRFETVSPTDFPGALKTPGVEVGSIYGTTSEFDFHEFPGPLTANVTYSMVVMNKDGSEGLLIELIGNLVIVEFGGPATAPLYTGVWNPNHGFHKFFVTISKNGVPRAWVDGVEIELELFGEVVSIFSFFNPNTINLYLGSEDTNPVSAEVTKAVFTAGIYPSETVFCCP